MNEVLHRKHLASAAELIERLALPASDATGLAWFDGKTRLIIVSIKKGALKRCAMQIPVTFDGFEVVVEPMMRARAVAA